MIFRETELAGASRQGDQTIRRLGVEIVHQHEGAAVVVQQLESEVGAVGNALQCTLGGAIVVAEAELRPGGRAVAKADAYADACRLAERAGDLFHQIELVEVVEVDKRAFADGACGGSSTGESRQPPKWPPPLPQRT